MTICIGKSFEFEASHKLPDDAIYGNCRKLHGHRYELMVEILGNINEYGWVCNFQTLKNIVNEVVINKYDHSYLNDFFEIPTVEIIVLNIYYDLLNAVKDEAFEMHKVRLFETRTSYAEIIKSKM